MRTTAIMSFAIVLMVALLVACGEAATPVPTNTPVPPTAAPAPTAAPTEAPTQAMAATEAPTEAMEEEDGDAMMWEVSDELKAYAAEHAGGPGAIYIGDGNLAMPSSARPSTKSSWTPTAPTWAMTTARCPSTPLWTSGGCSSPTTTVS